MAVFTSVTPEKSIRTIRSVLSVASLRSRGSGRNGRSTGHDDGDTFGAAAVTGKYGIVASKRPSESSAKLHPGVPTGLPNRDLESQWTNSCETGAQQARSLRRWKWDYTGEDNSKLEGLLLEILGTTEIWKRETLVNSI